MSNKNILMIAQENDAFSNKALKALFEKNFNLNIVQSESDAYTYINNTHPFLIFIDDNTSEINTFDFIKKINNIHVPLIIISNSINEKLKNNVLKINPKINILKKSTSIDKIILLVKNIHNEQKTLRDANKLFLENLFDAIPNPVFYILYDPNIFGCNSSYSINIMNTPKQNIDKHQIKKIDDFLPKELIYLYQQKENLSPFECQIKQPNGILNHYIINQSFIKNADFIKLGVVYLLQNITNRKNAEWNLVKRLEIEKTIFNISSQFIGHYNLDESINTSLNLIGKSTKAKNIYIYRTKLKKNYLVGTHKWNESKGNINSFFNELDINKYPWLKKKITKSNKIHVDDVSQLPSEAITFKELLKSKNIKSIIILSLKVKNELVGFIGYDYGDNINYFKTEDFAILSVSSEIISSAIEKKEAESDQERLSRAIEEVAESVVITTKDGEIEYVNPSFEKITGYSKKEVIGLDPSFLKSNKHKKDFYKNIFKTIQKDNVWRGHFINKKKNGELFEEDATISSIRNNNGKIINYVAVKRDISDKIILEKQLQQAQKLESIGQLAAGIAHEINTPIQYIGDNIYFLKDSFQSLKKLLNKYQEIINNIKTTTNLDKQIKKIDKKKEEIDLEYLLDEIPKAIEQSQDGVDRVTKIVKSMKEFSHPTAQEKSLININKAIENTITISRNEWKYISNIETSLDKTLPLIPCFPGIFNQVLLNLIINAAHAIDEAINKNLGEKGIIKITTKKVKDYVEIQISDTGTGIPKVIQQRIFDPFFTTKEVGKGTGQGLAIAYSAIVEKHNGQLSYITEEKKGTTFMIKIPINENLNNRAE